MNIRYPISGHRWQRWIWFASWAAAVSLAAVPTVGEERPAALNDAAAVVHLNKLCIDCHGAKKAAGKLRLDLPLAQFAEATWEKIVHALHHLDMPPEEAGAQPSRELRKQLEAWAQGHLDRHILKRAGDPGEVAWRRLTVIELENMIRDLTGRALPARDLLGEDATGGEGFSNIGAAQSSMTASLLDKYLALASRVGEHARFDANGRLVFDFPGAVEAPQVREDQAIIELQRLYSSVLGGLFVGPGQTIAYNSDGREVRGQYLKTERGWRGFGHYLVAVWLAAAQPDPAAALPQLAERLQLNPRFLAAVWRNWESCEPGSLEHLLWVAPVQSLPRPTSLDQDPPEAVRRTCDAAGNAFWQALREQGSGVIPRDPNRISGFPSTAQPVFTAVSANTLGDRANQKNLNAQPPLFIGVRTADGKPSLSDVRLGRPQIRITETRVEKIDGKERRTASVTYQPLPPESLETLPAGLPWSEHAFSGLGSEPRSLPALSFRAPVALRIDLLPIARLGGRTFDTDGRFHKGVAVDVVFPVDARGQERLLQVSVSSERTDLDLAAFAERTRFAAGQQDQIKTTWLAADDTINQAWRRQFTTMAQRWPPLAPLQMAPFGGERIQMMPPELAYFRDDARMQQWAMSNVERERADALWRYAMMLCGENVRRLRQFEERFGLSEADRADADQVRQILTTRNPQGRDPDHQHGVAPYNYLARWEHYRRVAAEDASFWRQRTLAAIEEFASRAWRRPLTRDEAVQFAAGYDGMKSLAERDAEAVLRALVARVLLSPHFLCRVARAGGALDSKPGSGDAPLTAWELASRLSMTLWASLPDDELRRCAADGSLLRDEVLRAQTRRMLADPRAGGSGLAEHFFGQWLGFAGFGTSTRGPDSSVFPEFTPPVRQSLHDEAVAFFEDLIRNDRDVRLMIDGDYSFLDLRLRGYYGMEPSLARTADARPSSAGAGPSSSAIADGLALWLDGADPATVVQTDGQVRQWRDKSGRENHLAQATPALQPVYVRAASQGLPAVAFDRDLLAATDERFAYDKHLILVVAQANQVGENDLLGSGGTGPGDILLMNYRNKYRGHFWSGGRLTVLDSQQPASSALAIYVQHSDGKRLSIRRNGSVDADAPLAGAPDRKPRPLIVGGRQAGGGSFVGQIAEALVFLGDVSGPDILRAEGYLAHKWKLADRLPAEHPGKAKAPQSVLEVFGLAGKSAIAEAERSAMVTDTANAAARPARIPSPSKLAPENGFELSDMRAAGRGGVLGLGAILISNSRQKRTSPTNRGLWVVEKLLGRHIPAPPPNVNPLPDEPERSAELSLLEQLRRHSREASCANCHLRIDPFGYALEAFDAAGRRRSREEVARLTFAADREGRHIDGMAGLQSYLRDHESELLRSMTRHFVGYALNRGTLISDRPLIDEIVNNLPKADYRFSTIVEHVVLSRQFRFQR